MFKITDEKLKDLLVPQGYINGADFGVAYNEAQKGKKDLSDILVDKNLIKDEELGELVAQDAGFKFINLRKEKIEEDVLAMIPEEFARERKVIAFSRTPDRVKVGMLDPEDVLTKKIIEKRFLLRADIFLITSNDFINALAKYKANIKSAFSRLLRQMAEGNLSDSESDQAIVEMVDSMLLFGYQNKASDIHLEPYSGDMVLARFRIDGVMYDMIEIPKAVFALMLSRIKIMSKMRTDEHQAALDGKLKFMAQDEQVDVRVSIVPVTGGENVVMRILSSKARQFGLTDLGMNSNDLSKVRRAIKTPHGMIIVTGPTGSGKTTTVYAVMKILNTRDVHISSIEDPVEYDIEGISQIQVNTKTGLTFSKGLKAIVRQDPDIIMIGEVRDEETADIAVNSAMTGHLVLTTLHANDAATTVPRLLDMNVEPFLVASTVNVVIAQRLVRQTCPKCRASYKLKDEDKELIKANPTLMGVLEKKGKGDLDNLYFYKGAGCPICRNSGFLGRVGIFEVMEMNEKIKELVTKQATSDEIAKMAYETGMALILEDGVDKILAGVTTIEEVLRVTKE